jgi:hypothetical protein
MGTPTESLLVCVTAFIGIDHRAHITPQTGPWVIGCDVQRPWTAQHLPIAITTLPRRPIGGWKALCIGSEAPTEGDLAASRHPVGQLDGMSLVSAESFSGPLLTSQTGLHRGLLSRPHAMMGTPRTRQLLASGHVPQKAESPSHACQMRFVGSDGR